MPPETSFRSDGAIRTERGALARACPEKPPALAGRVITLLLEDGVLAGVGFGERAGCVLVVLAEAAFDHLVLQEVFEVLDPTPRTPVELPHEVVAAQGALELLHGVLGPDLVHPAPEAAPGLFSDPPPPGRTTRNVRPRQLEEHVHVGEHVLAAGEVGVPDETPDRRVGPGVASRGVAHRPHVVGDEVGDGVYVVLRVGEALHRPARYGRPHVLVAVEVDLPGDSAPCATLALPLLGALPRALRPAVGAAVLVDQRSRLPDVVEESRLAQDRIGLDAGDHDQGVLEDVLVVELGLLLHVGSLHELGHNVGHEPQTNQRPQTRRHVLGDQYLLELLPYALGGDALQPASVVTDRPFQILRHCERLLRLRQSRLEADGAQHSQGVLAHSFERVADGPDHTLLQIFASLEGVYDLTRERVGSDGIDREVPACQILLQVISEAYLGVPAPLGILVGPVGGDLNLVLSYGGRYGPEALPHRPQVLGMRPQ